MKLSYLIPVYDASGLAVFLKSLVECEAYKSHECSEIVLCIGKKEKLDVESKKILSSVKTVVILRADGKFSFNDAFYSALEYIRGDALLLLDTALSSTPSLILKCLKKNTSGAKIVFVKKRREKVKGFFVNFFEKVYNLFVSLYTGKKDKCNIISMGLIDKYMLDILKEIPHRRCAIKNSEDLYKVKTSTIYVNPKIPCEKVDYTKNTNSKKAFLVSLSLFALLLVATIVLNIFTHIFYLNLLLVVGDIMSLFTAILVLPKHFYDCRNKNLNNVVFKQEKL